MRFTWLLVICAVAPVAQAQTPPQSPLAQRASQAWFAQDWARAAEDYGALARETPNVALPHFRLGVALINLGRPAEAGNHLEQAERLGMPLPQVAYRLAQVRAAAGDRDGAFAQLKRATDAGLPTAPLPVEQDRYLKPLMTDTRYQEFVTAMDRNARPCMHDPRYRQFDFWLGEWDVRPRGQPSAPPSTNVITAIHEGCVVLETYTAPGYTGQSFNIFDRTRGKWNQTWVDRMGGLQVYWGEARDGNLYYEGEGLSPTPPNNPVRTRLTFFRIASDTVRQFFESSADDGKTWTVNYDLLYTRKK